MAYTPILDTRHSCTLRRLAWATGKPMTKTIQDLFEHIAGIANRQEVCKACKDMTRCKDCAINSPKKSTLERILI